MAGRLAPAVGFALITAAGCTCSGSRRARVVSVSSLLEEMVDLEALAREPDPGFREALTSSADPASRGGGEAWFSNDDHDHFVRTDSAHGRTEDVLAELVGPGTITRIWTANPTLEGRLRFYFDGEPEPRLTCTMKDLFAGNAPPIGSDFAYVSAEAGNVYFPLPYARSLEVTREAASAARAENEAFYYQIGYRTYVEGTRVETFDPRNASRWADTAADVAGALARPGNRRRRAEWLSRLVAVAPGDTQSVRLDGGEVVEWSARVLDTQEAADWDDPRRAHNAYRFLLLEIAFDGESSIRVPLGDFFGSGPGVNPFENLAFKVEPNGRMTSRLRMAFRHEMTLSLTNAGKMPYSVELRISVAPHVFAARDEYLRAEWGTLTRESRPPFDMSVLEKSGRGKIVGTVFEVANPAYVWWGEGDQKIAVDGERFPSTFGTGTEDDYGFGYGSCTRFWRPYHAQTRVDGPGNGGHVSMNRLYVLLVLSPRVPGASPDRSRAAGSRRSREAGGQDDLRSREAGPRGDRWKRGAGALGHLPGRAAPCVAWRGARRPSLYPPNRSHGGSLPHRAPRPRRTSTGTTAVPGRRSSRGGPDRWLPAVRGLAAPGPWGLRARGG